MLPRSSNVEPTLPSGGRLDGFSTRRTTLATLAIAVAALALLAPALGGPFLWDDVLLIPNNATIQSLERWPEWFRGALFGEPGGAVGAARYWRPLALLSFALEWHFVGDNPALYHATNLVLYLTLVLFVGLTLRRYTANPAAATAATLLFALHPTHAECAAWISGRMDLLVSIGILGCCWAFARRVRQASLGLWCGEFSFASIAYMSKETAVLLPAFCFVEAWVALDKPKLSTKVLGRLTLALVPQLLLALAYGCARWLWFPLGNTYGAHQPSLHIVQRLGVFAETLGRAVALSIVPYPQRAQHGLVSLNAGGSLVFDAAYVALGLATVLTLVGAIRYLRRAPSALAAIGLAAIAFLPSSNLLSPWLLSCFTFERYLLLPHVGLAWAIAIAADHLCRDTARLSWRAPGILLGLLGLAVAAPFGWIVSRRAADYAEATRFWRHELRVNPASSMAPWSLSSLAAEPIAALDWLRLCHANASERRQFLDADHCLIAASETTLNVLLDAQTDELGRLQQVWTVLLRGSEQRSAAPAPIVRGITLAFPRDDTRRGELLAAYPGRIEADLALLYSRLGQHAAALQLAEESVARCRTCRWAITLSTVFAAAGQHQRAMTFLSGWSDRQPDLERMREQISTAADFYVRAQATQGPQHLHDLAQSLLSIGRFGLALATLEPAEAAILQAPEAAHDYALIAYRAGRDALARRVLLHYHAPQAVDGILSAWSLERPQLS